MAVLSQLREPFEFLADAHCSPPFRPSPSANRIPTPAAAASFRQHLRASVASTGPERRGRASGKRPRLPDTRIQLSVRDMEPWAPRWEAHGEFKMEHEERVALVAEELGRSSERRRRVTPAWG